MRSPFLFTLGMILIANHLLTSPVMAESIQQPEPKIRVKFDQELFKLAYSIFLANTNLTEALAVTERAIQELPFDKGWRRRGAETAEWGGRSDLALKHWFFLAQNGDKNAVQSALRISRSINEMPLRKKLLEQLVVDSTDLKLQKEYIAVLEGMGLPDEAYYQLVSTKMPIIDPVWHLTEIARLADVLGRPADAFAAWEKRATLKPLTSDEALHLAKLRYGQGDVDQAFKVLQQPAATTPESETLFWRTYTDLAWILQEIPDAIKGAELLIRTGNATEDDYQRIQLTFQESDPLRVYKISKIGWSRFKKPNWWYSMVNTGLRCGKAQELLSFFNNLKDEELRILSRDGESWYYLSQVYRQIGDNASSIKAAMISVRREPENFDLLISYLWLLVDLKQNKYLKPLVRTWEKRISTISKLREPLAAAMILIGEPAHALFHYRILASSRPDDPFLLATFAEVLEQTGHPETAWQVRGHAIKLINKLIYSGSETAISLRKDRQMEAQLMMFLTPGDGLSRLMSRVADDKDAFGKELVMAWTMTGGYTDMARLWYWRHFARSIVRPEWVQLGLALEENNQTDIADLIDRHLDRLPYRDAIEGAIRTGMIPTAETLAFEKLEQNDQDHLLDKQLRDLYENNSSQLQYNVAIQDRSGVGILDHHLITRFSIDSRTHLNIDLGTTDFRHQKQGVVGIYNISKQKGVLGFRYRYNAGDFHINAGIFDGLYLHPFGQIKGTWRFSSRLTVESSFAIGSEANESVPLLIGGMKDEITLDLVYRLTDLNNLKLQGATLQYMDQRRRYLGGGSSLNAELAYRINVAWPYFTIRLLGGYNQYHANGTPVEKTLALIPRNSPKNAGYFIPVSFGQFGTGISLGQIWKDTYSRNWKMFGAVDTIWNSISGTGFKYEVGAVGPLFGLDALLFSVSQESGSLGNSDITTRFDLKYRYLFN